MDSKELSKYFSELGKKGGKKSKRKLSSEEARRMSLSRKVVVGNGKKKVKTKRDRSGTIRRN